MTVMLLRLHPALASPMRWPLLSTGVLLLATLLTGALVAARTSAGRDFIHEAAWPAAAVLLWTAIALQLLLSAGRSRAGVLAMTLPVSGRRLWLTSLLSSFLTVSVTAVVMICGLEGADRLLRLRLGEPLFAGGALLQRGLYQVLAAALLASVLLHLPRPGQERWPMRGWLGIYGLGAVVIPGALLILLRGWPLAFAVACLLGAAVCLFWGLRRQPEAFLLEVKSPAQPESSASRMPAWPWLTAVRWTFGLPAMSAALATVMALGALQAVLSNRYSEEDETGLLMAPMLVYIMMMWLPMAGRFLHRLGPLPLSRWKTTAMVTLPVLVSALLGYLIGFTFDVFKTPGLRVEFQAQPGLGFPLQKSERALLRLPAQRYEIAWNGQAPELRAPWGESHKPWQARIWKGASAVLYSPVSTAETSSPEFAAWEISKALEMVYGVRVPRERIRATHIGLDGDGRPVLVKDLQDFLPEGTLPLSPLSWAVPPLTVAVCGASYLLLAGLLFGLRRADTPGWKRNTAVGVVMIGLMVAYMIRLPLSFSGLTRGWILGGAWSSLVRSAAAATPGGAVTFWLLCAVALFLTFHFAAARLAQAEILPEPPRRFGF
jgi:MFS family permease